MKNLTRRTLGAILVVLSLAMVPLLARLGVSMVTMGSAHFIETGTTKNSVHLHWPIAFPITLLVVGIAILVSRRHESSSQ